MGNSGPWKRTDTGVHRVEMKSRPEQFRHHTDSALMALHRSYGSRGASMRRRVSISLVALPLSGIAAVLLFSVLAWLGYVFLAGVFVIFLVVAHSMHSKEKCAAESAVVEAELNRRGVIQK